MLLEDTPENGAVWTVERLRRRMADQHPDLTMWAGVACYPAHAFDAGEIARPGPAGPRRRPGSGARTASRSPPSPTTDPIGRPVVARSAAGPCRVERRSLVELGQIGWSAPRGGRPSGCGRGSPTGGRRGPASACRRRSTIAPRAAVVRVGGDVGHRVDRRGRGVRPPRRSRSTSSSGRARRSSRPMQRVDLVAVLDPAGEGRRSARRRRAPISSITRSATDSADVLIATQRPSARAVGAAGHRVGDARAEARLQRSRCTPIGDDERAHELEQRLEQVDVDDLADAGVHRDHRGEGGDERGDLVGERDRRQQRAAVGLAVDARRSPTSPRPAWRSRGGRRTARPGRSR